MNRLRAMRNREKVVNVDEINVNELKIEEPEQNIVISHVEQIVDEYIEELINNELLTVVKLSFVGWEDIMLTAHSGHMTGRWL